MKRSQINAQIRRAIALAERFNFALPPFAHWSADDWLHKGVECDEIRDNMLGWDVTDYGLGRFGEIGLVLITIRNGSAKNANYPKKYAEKLLLSAPGQVCPMHFHFSKREDIINRGGGTLVMKLFNSDANGGLADTGVLVSCDGVSVSLPAGHELELAPGQSVTLTPGMYHAFWAKGSDVLIGEVSECNDDVNDNRFLDNIGRFPEIDEDEPPFRLLCTEYPRVKA